MSHSSRESEPLLGHPNGAPNGDHRASFFQRTIHAIKADGEPTWIESYRHFFFGSWLNLFLVFVPLSFISHWSHWDAALRFSFSFVAIIPLAKLLGDATEQLSLQLGQTLSGLLNASFGNAVEIIVGVAALLQNELRIVQTSMLGSILSNLLLVLGCSFLAGGCVFYENRFDPTAAQTSSSLMTLACITLVIPAAYHTSKNKAPEDLGNALTKLSDTLKNLSGSGLRNGVEGDASHDGLLLISRGTAIMLLIVYVAYLIFQLKTHDYLFHGNQAQLRDRPTPGSDSDVAVVPEEEPESAKMSMVAAGVGLLLVTVVTSFCADYLVASIEETATRYHIPKPFIGLVMIPIVANAAEHVTAVWMAMKGKSELTITICVGSSIQIATFVIPLLVIIGWITGHELTLFFADFETIVLFVSVLLVNLLIMDGKSNYMEGLMLVTLYLVISLAFWVS